MKIIVVLLMFLCTKALAEDNNIISVTAGVQSVEDSTTTTTNANSSSTTTTTTGHGHNASSTTSTSNNSVPSTSSSSSNQNDGVFGIQYQHKMGGSVWLGVLVQTNKTYSLSYGIGF